MSGTKPLSLNGSCLRTGIQESDTGDSGEESEPTYRHYDHFETDVCLTQDEDDDDEPLVSGSALIRGAGTILGSGSIVNNNSITRKHGDIEISGGSRDGVLGSIRENGGVPGGDGNGGKRPVSSSSDSLTESEVTCTGGMRDVVADDTTTATSTSESEETQIWVPLSKRPSLRQGEGSMTPRFGGSVSNCSDGHPPQSLIHKTHSPSPDVDIYAGGRTITVSAGGQTVISDGQLDSRDTWGSVQSKRQSATVQRRATPPQQLSLGLLRHDESMGTITLDISNMLNGNAELRYGDGRSIPLDGTTEATSSSPPTARRRAGVQKASSRISSMADGLGTVCSGLYMLLLVVAGLVVPVAEIFADQKYIAMLEGFYIYLHLLSIVCLAHAYIYILRMRALVSRCRGPTVSASRPGRVPVSRDTGSFCIRLGAVGFGIGGMIKSGLHFGEYFEMTSSPFCSHVLFGIRPLLHLCFTFIQLYFVFLNSKMLVYQYTLLARFVLMHMVATNTAIWLEAVVKEILRGLRHVEAVDVGTNGTTSNTSVNHVNGNVVSMPLTLRDSGCYGDALMAEVVTTSSPYLYPCTVIFSLICGSILFTMWLKLGRHNNNRNEDSTHVMSDMRSAIDCSSSSRGLFVGLIILVETVIVLITFFVLARTIMFADTAISLDHAGDIVNFIVTIIAILLAFYRMHGFEYKRTTSHNFETVLLVISLLGVYILGLSYIIAAALGTHENHVTLVIMSNVLRITEGTLQTVFLVNTVHRCASTQEQESKKPGREFAMFLLICNLALLGKTIFEGQRSDANPTQAQFYGVIVWSIVTKVTVPLCVLFRFLSAVCLACIWKTNWRQRNSA